MFRPDAKEFLRLAREATLVPVSKAISADLQTPVSAFLSLAESERYCFLLESVERGEKIGRFTFLGVRPSVIVSASGDTVRVEYPGQRRKAEVIHGGDEAGGRRGGKAGGGRGARAGRGSFALRAQDDSSKKRRDEDGSSVKGAGVERGGAGRALVFEVVRKLLREHRPAHVEGLPPFTAGAVGYASYDVVRQLERIGESAQDDLQVPDAVFMVFDRLLAFDHLRHEIHIIAAADVRENPRRAWEKAQRDIAEIEKKLARGVPGRYLKASPVAGRRSSEGSTALSREGRKGPTVGKRLGSGTGRGASVGTKGPTLAKRGRGWGTGGRGSGTGEKLEVSSTVTPKGFKDAVRRAKEYIAAGDIFQVVLSQRLAFDPGVEPLAIYRALRRVNPSPYMYCLRMGGMHVLGSSPEMLVRVRGRKIEYRPIAGTLPRGKDDAEDERMEQQLRGDEKERAEHIMLVDLGRNDVGRVSDYGTVKVTDLMYVERYSHVMHLVSSVEGKLREELDAFDALAACFPAGTLSGAPKVRAMQIIEELEPVRRGIYGGCVLYADYAGNLDSCIVIRTMLTTTRNMNGEEAFRAARPAHDAKIRAYVQAGAGIVADSDPEREFEECMNKARALVRAAEMARTGE